MSLNDIDVTCSWQVLNDRCLKDAISINSAQAGKSKDLESIVCLETCINLGAANESSACTLNMKAENLKIKELTIVSEARILEIYGRGGEYLMTTHAKFLDEYEGMVTYVAEIKLCAPTTECSIKFACLKDKEHMWIYGIDISVEKMSGILAQTAVNFQNVNSILKESGHQITEKAEKCKKFLQLYSSYLDTTKSYTKPPNKQLLCKLLEAEYISQCNQLGAQAKTVTQCIADIMPSFSLRAKEKLEGAENTGLKSEPPSEDIHLTDINVLTNNHVSVTDEMTQNLKTYISEQCNLMEKRILSHVERKLEELNERQNEKLDKILVLLNVINTQDAICITKNSSCK